MFLQNPFNSFIHFAFSAPSKVTSKSKMADHHLNRAVQNSNHTQGMMMNMREYLLNKQKQIISKNE